jgi:hypothetical protein
MIESLALDALLLVIVISVVPLGMFRGGIREVCTSAGLLLGILIAQQWSDRWGDWVADVTGIDEGVSRFLVAIASIVTITGIVGYGAASAFGHRPGPGGRLFGGLLALANAVVFLGALIQFVADDLYEGVYPGIIQRGYVARALSSGFDWVLLAATGAMLVGILFGMVVRERDIPDEEILVPASRESTGLLKPVAGATAAKTSIGQPSPGPSEPEVAAPPVSTVRVREVRHWEESVPSTIDELQSGWTRTWPTTVTSSDTTTPRRSGRGLRSDPRRPSSASDQEVVRQWLHDDKRPAPDDE